MDNQPLQVSQYQYQQTAMQAPQPQAQLGMFQRRIGRLGFLLGIIYWAAILIVPALLQLVVHFALNGSTSSTGSNPLIAIANIISILFGIGGFILLIPIVISLYVRRLHDVNQSGLLTLLVLVPLVNLLLFLYLLFAPGNPGQNKYGEAANSYNYWVVIGFKKP